MRRCLRVINSNPARENPALAVRDPRQVRPTSQVVIAAVELDGVGVVPACDGLLEHLFPEHVGVLRSTGRQ